MQQFTIEAITGGLLGLVSFFIYAFSIHMYRTGKTLLTAGMSLRYLWGTVLVTFALGVLIGAPLALLVYSPVAFAACAAVSWLYWFKNMKF